MTRLRGWAVTAAAVLALAAATATADGADIDPYTSSPVEPVGSTPVEPVGSTPVEPVGSTPVAPTPPGGTPGAPSAPSQPVPIGSLLGRWMTGVPGAAWVTEGVDYDTHHVSPGSGVVGRLVIRRNRTYTWKGKSGRWRKTGDPEWPMVLLRVKAITPSGRSWKVSTKDGGGIYVWDGYTWYEGH